MVRAFSVDATKNLLTRHSPDDTIAIHEEPTTIRWHLFDDPWRAGGACVIGRFHCCGDGVKKDAEAR